MPTQENTNEVTQDSSNQLASTTRSKNNSKRKRAFVSDGLDIETYHKKPKITSRAMIAINDERRSFVPKSHHTAKTKDTLWMIECSYSDKETPMWVGWNSLYVKDEPQAKEKMHYLPQINLSPTSTAVVRETLKRAQQMATECGMATIPVTYDLAIAKMAPEIQAEESPQFDMYLSHLVPFTLRCHILVSLGSILLTQLVLISLTSAN